MTVNIWDKLWKNNLRPDYHPELVEIVKKFSPGKKILEIGFGSGADLSLLSKIGFKCFGLESSKVALTKSREKKEMFRSYFGDAESCPFQDKKFDLIFHQGVMEHFKDSRRFISEHWRLLKDSGVVVIDVPHKWNLYTLYRNTRNLFGNWYGGWERSYSEFELCKLAERSGFETVGIFYRGIWPHRWGKFLFPERIINNKLIKVALVTPPLLWFQRLVKWLYEKVRFVKVFSSYNIILVARKRPIRVLIDLKTVKNNGGGIQRYVSKIINMSDKSNFIFTSNLGREFKPDVYHAAANWGLHVIPTVVTVHDIIPAKIGNYFDESKFPMFSKLFYILRIQVSLWFSSKVICTSKIGVKDVSSEFLLNKKKTQVIPMAVDDSFFAPKKHEDRKILRSLGIKTRYILCHGGIDRRKNVESLIKAIVDIPLDLVISGSNPNILLELKRLAEDLRVIRKVKFCGWVNDKHIAILVRNADTVVYPSKLEGFGMPMLESMAAGVPIVASNIPILRKLGRHVPIYINPYSINSIEQGINKALSSRSNNRIFEGKKIAKLYLWSNTVKKTCKIYFDAFYGL